MSKRVLILSATTGYQLRSFGDAAKELGIELVFATDRRHALDDPWRDGAVAIRFHERRRRGGDRGGCGGAPASARCPGPRRRPRSCWPRELQKPSAAGHPPHAASGEREQRLARETPLSGRDCGCRSSCNRPRAPTSSRSPCGCNTRSCSSRGAVGAEASSVPTPRRSWLPFFQRVSTLLSRFDIRAQRSGSEGELLIESFIPGHERSRDRDGRTGQRLRGVRQT